jgi:hypothetical protein
MTFSGGEPLGADLTVDRPLGEEDRRSLETRIAALSVPQKVELATKGNREVRKILSRDASVMVARAVIGSPKLSEDDIATFAASSQTNEEILRAIADNRQWTANRKIVTAIVYNPRTPPPAAIRFLRSFQANELRILTHNRTIASAVRQEAKRLLAQRI